MQSRKCEIERAAIRQPANRTATVRTILSQVKKLSDTAGKIDLVVTAVFRAKDGRQTHLQIGGYMSKASSIGKNRYRVRHIPTGAWWDGEASSPEEAIQDAKRENLTFRKGDLDIKVKTYKGYGGWAKVRV